MCFTSDPRVTLQGRPDDVVVVAEENHESFVPQLLSQLRRTAEVGEQDRPYGRIGVGLPRWMPWQVSEEGVDRTVTHFDHVVSNQTVSFAVDLLERLSVGSLGETEDRPVSPRRTSR